MGIKARKYALSCFLSVLMVFAVISSAQAYSSVLAFGDSVSDNGYSDSDPFGAIVMSNGPVWVEYLADNLGATLNDMAYSGATTGLDNPALAQYFFNLGDMEKAAFFSANSGLQWQAGAYATNFGPVADDTLITISAGGNDMFNGRSAVTAANNVAGMIAYMIALGGDDFLVMNLSTGQQNEAYTAWMNEFNAALSVNLGVLGLFSPAANLFLLDMNNFVADVDNYTGTWLADSCDSPYAVPGACSNETFAWYDTVGVHPTTQVHQQIAEYAMNAVAPVPEPATIFLMLTGMAGLVGVRRKKKK